MLLAKVAIWQLSFLECCLVEQHQLQPECAFQHHTVQGMGFIMLYLALYLTACTVLMHDPACCLACRYEQRKAEREAREAERKEEHTAEVAQRDPYEDQVGCAWHHRRCGLALRLHALLQGEAMYSSMGCMQLHPQVQQLLPALPLPVHIAACPTCRITMPCLLKCMLAAGMGCGASVTPIASCGLQAFPAQQGHPDMSR